MKVNDHTLKVFLVLAIITTLIAQQIISRCKTGPETWSNVAAILLLCGFIAMPTIGILLQRRSQRVRQIVEPSKGHQLQSSPELILSVDDLVARLRRAVRLSYIAPVPIILFLVILYHEILSPTGLLIAISLLITIFLLFVWLANVGDRRTLNLIGNTPLIFRVNSTGLHIPVLVLSGASCSRAIRAGIIHLDIQWKDIVSWVVWPSRGKSGSLHKIEVSDNNALVGTGPFQTGSILDTKFVSIKRYPLRKIEHQILAVAREHLSCPIEIRDELLD